MVEGRVDEDPAIVPSTGLDSNRLVNQATLSEKLVRQHNRCEASSSKKSVSA